MNPGAALADAGTVVAIVRELLPDVAPCDRPARVPKGFSSESWRC